MTALAWNVRSVLLAASEGRPLCKLRRETVLFHQQHTAAGVFLVESGLIKLTRTSTDESRFTLSVIGHHQLVGEECLTEENCTYFAESACLTDVAGYYVPTSAFQRLLTIPELSALFVSYLVCRNGELIQKAEMLALRDVEHRVLYGLATLARLVKPAGGGASFPIPMSQAEIAGFIGVTRETTSTTLGVLKDRGLLTLSRRLVTTIHPDLLIAAANHRLTRASAAP